LIRLNSERKKKHSEYSIHQGADGLEIFQAKNNAPITLDFDLVDYLHMKSGKLRWLAGHKSKEKSSRNATPLRPLLGLVFAWIINRNECSAIGKNMFI